MTKKPIKIGFDLDGVILYNPIRIVRPILSFFRKTVIKKEKKIFYIPETRIEKMFWFLLHKTSFTPAKGYKKLQFLVSKKRIQAYLITGRYSALESDFISWTKKLNAKSTFVKFVYNIKNKQPHEFKKLMIAKYNLDVFVDDNWDIVNLLSKNKKQGLKILWITNLLDQFISYKYKFYNLDQVLDFIEKKYNL
jgi:hypothetical protein